MKRLRLALAVAVVLAAWVGVAASSNVVSTSSVIPDSIGGLTEEQRRELDRIATLGYVAGGGPAPDEMGVRIASPSAFDGYTVYVSGDYPGAFVVDMEGRIVHTWQEDGPKFWARAWVYPDGSILGVSAFPARLVKLDSDSHLLWEYGGFILKAHHDVRVEPDGTIYLLARRARKIPWFASEGGVNEDLICVLSPEGDSVDEIERISILEAFRRSEHSDMLSESWFVGSDPLHVNSIEILDGRIPHPAFRSGNVLLSCRNIDCLAVLDLDLREIVWVNRGPWQRQHEARATREGRIILFDNRPDESQSRIVEYDVVSDDIVWSYAPAGFHSRGAGAEQQLPNGNILITESQKGRILEITPEGRTVWEYINPRRISGGQTIVRLPRAYRVPRSYFKGRFGGQLLSQCASE